MEVRDLLNRLNSDLNVANYSVRIVSEETDAQALLEKFQAIEKPTPVIATTVDLLSTGVDAPISTQYRLLQNHHLPDHFQANHRSRQPPM